MLRRTEIVNYRNKCPICGSEDTMHCQKDRRIDLSQTAFVLTSGKLSETVICKDCGYLMEFIDPTHLEQRR